MTLLPSLPKRDESNSHAASPSTSSHELPQIPRIENPSDHHELPPTDVGITPWLQTLGGFLLMFNAWGIAVSYGPFQTYYTSGGITDADSPSTIAWIGSIQAFLLMFGGALCGKYFDAGHFRQMICIGSVMVVFGLMMTSLSDKYYQFMLAQGICVGCGMALIFMPSIGLPSTWFSRRRGLALGIVTSGASVGGVIWPIVLHRLIPQIGFPWAVRVWGFISLVTLSVPLAVMRQRLPPRKRGSFVEYRALLEPEFALYNAGVFITFLGFFTFYNFIQEWAVATRVDTKGLPVFYLIPILNAASAFGRLVPNFASDRIGPLNVQAPAMAIAGVLVLVWIPTHTIGPILVVVILYGFFSGALVGLPPAAVASMTRDMTRFGGRLGVAFMAMSFSSLIGAPVTGAIVQREGGGYDGARIWAGTTMIVGAVFVFLGRMVKTRWVLAGKV